MTISNMAFTPTGGLKDASYSPTTPVSEISIRTQIQGVSDQLRDYINGTTNPLLDNTITNTNNAVTTSNTANSNSNSATNTAGVANTNAINAVNTSNIALTSANNAISTANTASTNATNAVNTSNTASNTANTASTNATNAVNSVANKCDKAYVDNLATGFTLGAIPDNSLTDIKLNSTGIKATVANNTNNLADNVKHPIYSVTTGSANAYVVAALTTYSDGTGITIKINVDSSGVSTLNGYGLKNSLGNDVTNLKSGGIYSFRYNATTSNFIIQSEGVDATSLITTTNNILNM